MIAYYIYNLRYYFRVIRRATRNVYGLLYTERKAGGV